MALMQVSRGARHCALSTSHKNTNFNRELKRT